MKKTGETLINITAEGAEIAEVLFSLKKLQ